VIFAWATDGRLLTHGKNYFKAKEGWLTINKGFWNDLFPQSQEEGFYQDIQVLDELLVIKI
jgi:hypothetical protein